MVSVLVCFTRAPSCLALEAWFSSQALLWIPAASRAKPLWFFLIHWAREAVRGTQLRQGWGQEWAEWDAEVTNVPQFLQCSTLSFLTRMDVTISVQIWGHWRVWSSSPRSHSHSGGWMCLSTPLSHFPAWNCYSLSKASSVAENQGVDGVQFTFLGFCAK